MRFHSRRRPNKNRSAKLQRRVRARRGGMLELLERREMLAADMPSPLQNPMNRYDVNADQRISPNDLLTIINDLSRNGSHSVEGSVVPLAAGTGTPTKYLDVNGDGRVSPLDMLNVINELADPAQMSIRVFPTDLAGNPISTIPVGGQFLLETVVQDVRSDPQFQGVFSAGVDISYDTTYSSHDPNQTPNYDDFWDLNSTELSTQGRIIGYGATFSGTAPGNAPQFLFSVVMTADAPGTQTFVASFDNTVSHDYGLYGDNAQITSDEVDFMGSMLEITSDASISISDVSQSETNADTTYNFTASLTMAQSQDVTVAFTTSDGTATAAGNDFAPTSGSITFLAGQTTAVIPVTVHGDTIPEPDETFNVTLSNPMPTYTITKATGVGTILNDDVASELSITGATVTNVTAGTTTANVTVSVGEAVSMPVTVVYATADNTAFAGVDYEATSGTLTFTPTGGLTQVVPITIIGDPNPDNASDFFVNLSDPSANAVLVNDQATVQINPAVKGVTFSVDDVLEYEGNPGETTDFVFTVTLSQSVPQQVVLGYATGSASDTATAGSDYTATSGTISFNPGETSQTVTVHVIGDSTMEDNETFTLNVVPVSGASGTAEGTGTIVDDEGTGSLVIQQRHGQCRRDDHYGSLHRHALGQLDRDG